MPQMMQLLEVNAISNEECRKYLTPADETHLCTLNGKGEGICMVSVLIRVKSENLLNLFCEKLVKARFSFDAFVFFL